MKVKMLTTLAGPEFTCQAGETCDVPDAMADDLLDGGYAEEVEDQVKAEELDQADVDEQPAATQPTAPQPTASVNPVPPAPKPAAGK